MSSERGEKSNSMFTKDGNSSIFTSWQCPDSWQILECLEEGSGNLHSMSVTSLQQLWSLLLPPAFFHPSQDLFLCHLDVYLPWQVWGMARTSLACSSDVSTEQGQAPSAACVSSLFFTLLSSMNITRTDNCSWAAKIKPWFPHRISHWSQNNSTTMPVYYIGCCPGVMCFRPWSAVIKPQTLAKQIINASKVPVLSESWANKGSDIASKTNEVRLHTERLEHKSMLQQFWK